MAAHRYWRVNITGIQDPINESQIGIVEFQFRVTAGVSLTFSGGTASTDDGGTAANASDDNTSTTWTTTAGTTASWWKYDYGLGNDKDIVELTIRVGTNLQGRAPRDFTLEWSDDNVAWTVLLTATAVNDWTSAQTKTFTSPFGTPTARVSQVPTEVAIGGINAQVSQVALETISVEQYAQISQVPLEVATGKNYAKVSQVPLEVATGKNYAKVSQTVLEIIFEYVELAGPTQPFIWVFSG